MKLFKLFILIFILSSCATTKSVNNNPEPLWFSNDFNYLDTEKYIIYKAHETTYEKAEAIIYNDSSNLADYILPTKNKELILDNSVYLLFSIKKIDLKKNLDLEFNLKLTELLQNIKKGDKASDLLEKYTIYKSIEPSFRLFDNILSLYQKFNLEIPTDISKIRNDLNSKIILTKKEFIIGIKVKGDSNKLLESNIINELHRLGYETSENATIILDVSLNLEDALLNNKYINKYWNLSIDLKDSYGNSKKSLLFNGRESHLTEVGLNQLIIKAASVKVNESLKEILP